MKKSAGLIVGAALLIASGCGSDDSSSSSAPDTAPTETAAPDTASPADTAAPDTAAPDTAAPDTPGAQASAALADYLEPAETITIAEPLSAPPQPGVKVTFIGASVGPAPSFGVGAKAASEAIGWEYSELAVDLRNPATVNSAVLQAIDGGADVILTAALDQALMQDALNTAKERGVFVIDAATSNSTGEGITAIIGSTGQAAQLWAGLPALQMIVDSDGAEGAADVALVFEPQLETVHRPNLDAVKAELDKYCPDTCTTTELGVPIGDVQAGAGPATIISFLQQNPDIDYLYLAGPELAIGLPAALAEAGLSDVKFLGSAPDEAAITETANGNGAGWGAVPFVQWGWQLVDAGIRAVNGDDLAAAEKAGIPIWLVNPDNAADVTFENQYPSAPAGYAEQFTTLWGL
jgi:ribose transport system substrate-binding protein